MAITVLPRLDLSAQTIERKLANFEAHLLPLILSSAQQQKRHLAHDGLLKCSADSIAEVAELLVHLYSSYTG